MLKYSPRNCEIAKDALQRLYGVKDIKTNPSTGSLTIHYDKSAIEVDQLLSTLKERQLVLNVDTNKKRDSRIDNIAMNTGAKLSKAMLSFFVSKTLKANGLSLLAALI
jgi:Zn-dependent membrane protease YugP